MANIKSAVKRIGQALARAQRNRATRSRLRTTVKAYRETEDGSKAAAVPATFSEVDTAWRKGVIHKNAAARYKSRLAKKASKKASKV